MSNKTQLQTNNNALEALISRVNAAKDTAASLPEAGGTSAPPCYNITVTFQGSFGYAPNATFYYFNTEGQLQCPIIASRESITVCALCGILYYIGTQNMFTNFSGECQSLMDNGTIHMIQFNSDGGCDLYGRSGGAD